MSRVVVVLLMFLPTLLLPRASFAEGSGTRGGGEIVDLTGRPRLRDLVDKTVCRWQKGPAFAKSVPAFASTLHALADVHWYLAGAIERELDRLVVCRTKSLIPVDTQDFDAVTLAVHPKHRKQVAIRLNAMIFVDDSMMSTLPASDQGMLLVHEISHSFIPLRAERRNDKLRSFVQIVSQNVAKRVDAEDLALNLKMNDVSVIHEAQPLTPVKAQVEAVLHPKTSNPVRMAAYRDVSSARIATLLWAGDRESAHALASPLFDRAKTAIKTLDHETLQDTLSQGVLPAEPFFDGTSLLDLALAQKNTEAVAMLLAALESSPGSSLTAPNAADELLLKVIQGQGEAVSVERLLQLGANPNRVVTFKVTKESPETFATAFTAAVMRGRIDIALRFIERNGQVAGPVVRPSRPTLMEAFPQVLRSQHPGAPSLLRALFTGPVAPLSLETLLPNGQRPVHEAVASSNVAALTMLLTLGADVNGQNASQQTAFDLAVNAKDAAAATLLCQHPRFTYQFRESGSPQVVHAKAKWVLQRFVELNQPRAVASLFATYAPTYATGHPLGWFDLYPFAEMAHVRGFFEVENLIRQKMQRR